MATDTNYVKVNLDRVLGKDGAMPNWVSLVFGALIVGGTSANIAGLQDSDASNIVSLRFFNILILILGVLILCWGLAPTVMWTIRLGYKSNSKEE